jgi:hypothetical protein
MLDVTDGDLRQLRHVAAHLYSRATRFDAPQLQTSGNIDARAATTFSAPQLQNFGNIDATLAASPTAPRREHKPTSSPHTL